MKIIKYIAIVLAVVLAGGACATFIRNHSGGSSDRVVELGKAQEEHLFLNFTSVVPASEDPDGIGYEFYSCDCGYMNKVVANHESGHFFVEQKGKLVCNCGAQIVGKNVVVSENDFETKNTLSLNNVESSFYSEGKIMLSAANTQLLLVCENNSEFKNLLNAYYSDNVYNGETLEFINFSFDILYSGKFSVSDNGHPRAFEFLNYQTMYPFNLYFKNSEDGKIIVFEKRTPERNVVLDENISYTFLMKIDVERKYISLYVDGGIYNNFELFDVYCPDYYSLLQIGISRTTFYCEDGSFELYMDNMKLSYSFHCLDTSALDYSNYCAHDFSLKGFLYGDYSFSEGWKKFVCDDCGRYYHGH